MVQTCLSKVLTWKKIKKIFIWPTFNDSSQNSVSVRGLIILPWTPAFTATLCSRNCHGIPELSAMSSVERENR